MLIYVKSFVFFGLYIEVCVKRKVLDFNWYLK